MTKKIVKVFSVVLLLCSVCQVHAVTPICLNANWVMPKGVHPLWRDWMASKLIKVTLGGATMNGQKDAVKTTSIDYEQAHGSIELDFAGLPDDTRWMVFASIKAQTIVSPDGEESFSVSAPVEFEFYQGLDDEEYPYEYSFFLTLQISEVE